MSWSLPTVYESPWAGVAAKKAASALAVSGSIGTLCSSNAPACVDRELPEGEAHVNLDPQGAQPHEVVDDPPGHGGIVEQPGLSEHLLVVESEAFVGARVVEMTPGRARVGPGQRQLLVVRSLVGNAGTRVGGVGPVEVGQVRSTARGRS